MMCTNKKSIFRRHLKEIDIIYDIGGVPEWFNGLVSKTRVVERLPGVRILSPPHFEKSMTNSKEAKARIKINKLLEQASWCFLMFI